MNGVKLRKSSSADGRQLRRTCLRSKIASPAALRRRRTYYPHLAANDPNRSPAWRWNRALNHVCGDLRYSPRRDDETTARAVRFRRVMASCRTRKQRLGLQRRDPALYSAYEVFSTESRRRTEIEARLLAGQSIGLVAQLSGIPHEVIEIYEAVFFNVTDRLSAKDWVMAQAVGAGPYATMTTSEFGRYLKTAAYCNGPVVLDAFLSTVVADDGGFTLAKLTNWSTPEGRTAARLAIGIVTEIARPSLALITELKRICNLIDQMERRNGTLEFDFIPSEHIESNLTATIAPSPTRSEPSSEDLADKPVKNASCGETLMVA